MEMKVVNKELNEEKKKTKDVMNSRNTKDVRLNRALEDVEKYKSLLETEKSLKRESSDSVRRDNDKLKSEIKRLERQKVLSTHVSQSLCSSK